MDTPVNSRKRPASSLLNAKAHQPTASVGSISPPRAWPPPPTDNEFMLRKEGVMAKEIVASQGKAPPAFCTKAKVAKGVAYLWDTMIFDFHLRLPHVYFLTLCSTLEVGFIHLYRLPPVIHPLLFSSVKLTVLPLLGNRIEPYFASSSSLFPSPFSLSSPQIAAASTVQPSSPSEVKPEPAKQLYVR